MTEWGETFPSIDPEIISHQFTFCSELVVVKYLWSQFSVVCKPLHKLIPPGSWPGNEAGLVHAVIGHCGGGGWHTPRHSGHCCQSTAMPAPDSPETSCPLQIHITQRLKREPSLCHILHKSWVSLLYTYQNWAWGFIIWCSLSPQSSRSATGFELQNFNLHWNSCPPQWRKLPGVVREDRH